MKVTDNRIRVLFLTRTLGIGGRERQLVTLVKGLDKTRFDVTVVTFYAGGEFDDVLRREPGIRLFSLGKRNRWDLNAFIFRLSAVTREVRPHIIHGYGMVANELSWLMGRLYQAKVVWGIRTLAPEMYTKDRWLHILDKLGLRRHLASKVDLIIVNSQAGFRTLASSGYPTSKILVIPNGIDTDYFSPIEKSAVERAITRGRWGISLDCVVLALVARVDPNKGHKTFLRAAAQLKDTYPSVRYVFVGSGDDFRIAELHALSQNLGVKDQVVWAGWERDMPSVYAAIDIANTISEEREGFPNAVAEAMSCGIPCVVTDVGDAPLIVGDTGLVVARKDPMSLAWAWQQLLSLSKTERCELGYRARQRIVANFDVSLLLKRTQEAFESLLE